MMPRPRSPLSALPLVLCGGALALAAPSSAHADDTVAAPPPARADAPPRTLALSGSYVADTVVVADGPQRGTRYVDLLRVDATADLDRAIGWNGAKFTLTFEAGTGAQPNALADTVEGIDNAETTLDRPRLFQAFLEQDLGLAQGSLKLGFVDLNSDFYATSASGLLLAPPFGIGSELAASGPNGPSIFPSTAPTVTLKLTPLRDLTLMVSAVNAEAGVIGDPGGPPPLLRQGALLIGEADWTGNGREDAEGKVALGAWTYTRPQDDQRETDLTGAPLRRKAWGAYALVQQPLGSKVTTFLRGGISDGWTTPFSGSLQAGVLVDGAIPGRPDSVFSAGFHAGFLARGWRANLADAGQPQRATELGWEVTLEDKVLPWLKIQPDLQYIRDPAIAPRQDAIVAVLRLTLLPPGQD